MGPVPPCGEVATRDWLQWRGGNYRVGELVTGVLGGGLTPLAGASKGFHGL